MPKVYILILNWNGWTDTIECLETVFRNNYQNYRVIVCDNDSTDSSMEMIRAWAEGLLEPEIAADISLRTLSSPSVAKPVTYVEYSRSVAENGGDADDGDTSLILIRTGANLGFAGGNNVGLRYAVSRGDFEYVWLLNNDTVIKPDALSKLVLRMQERPDAGMCGSTVPFYHEPDRVWALGGASYNKWLAKTDCIGFSQPLCNIIDRNEVEQVMAYPVGASTLVSHRFLEDVGLMCEEYFLYFEELDWAERGKGRFSIVYAPESIVYHKVGVSTGLAGRKNRRRNISADYMRRNQVLFTRKFFPWAMPSVAVMVGIKRIKSFLYKHLMSKNQA